MSKSLNGRDGRVARREQTRARLLAATIELFATSGYAGTSIDEIADLAGVSKGSVFYNFGSKEDLFESALHLCAERLSEAMLEAKGSTHGAEALDRIVPVLFSCVSDNRAATSVLIGELLRTGRPWSKSVPTLRKSILSPLVDSLTEYMDELGAAGTIRKAVPSSLLETIATMVWGSAVAVSLDATKPSAAVAEHAINATMHFLAAYRGDDEDCPALFDEDCDALAGAYLGEGVGASQRG